jgi:hypothetical protein
MTRIRFDGCDLSLSSRHPGAWTVIEVGTWPRVKVVLNVARIARWLASAAAVATALLVLALYDEDWKVGVAALAAVPAVVLFLFSSALAEAAALPERLRNAPSNASELQASLVQLSRARRGRWIRPLWRTGRAAAGARELVTPWAPLLPLVNLPFLVATLASALVTPLLVLGALAMLVVYG